MAVGGVFKKPKLLKESMKLNWNFFFYSNALYYKTKHITETKLKTVLTMLQIIQIKFKLKIRAET